MKYSLPYRVLPVLRVTLASQATLAHQVLQAILERTANIALVQTGAMRLLLQVGEREVLEVRVRVLEEALELVVILRLLVVAALPHPVAVLLLLPHLLRFHSRFLRGRVAAEHSYWSEKGRKTRNSNWFQVYREFHVHMINKGLAVPNCAAMDVHLQLILHSYSMHNRPVSMQVT